MATNKSGKKLPKRASRSKGDAQRISESRESNARSTGRTQGVRLLSIEAVLRGYGLR